MAQASNPPTPCKAHGPVYTLFVHCMQSLYVRYSLHTPPPLWDGWGLGSLSLVCKAKSRWYVATTLSFPPYGKGMYCRGTM